MDPMKARRRRRGEVTAAKQDREHSLIYTDGDEGDCCHWMGEQKTFRLIDHSAFRPGTS